MRILGIDPGTALTGYAVMDSDDNSAFSLVAHGVIRTSQKSPMHKRLNMLHDELLEIAQTHTPKVMSIERLFFNTNAKTAMTVGQARGVVMLVGAKTEAEIYEYTALQAKKALTNYGRADKKEMQEAVRKFIGLKEIIKPDDANDAVAMAICHILLTGLAVTEWGSDGGASVITKKAKK